MPAMRLTMSLQVGLVVLHCSHREPIVWCAVLWCGVVCVAMIVQLQSHRGVCDLWPLLMHHYEARIAGVTEGVMNNIKIHAY